MAEAREWPPIILYGVIINEAIQSGDKEVMHAVAKVSKFMMDRVGDGADEDNEIMSNWKAAHEDLMRALN